MNANSEGHEQTAVEPSPAAAAAVTETENTSTISDTTDEKSSVEQSPAVEEHKPQVPLATTTTTSASSWLSNLGLSPNLTSQLTNISSSLIQATSKVTAAANTLVQKSLPQRPTSPTENEQAEPVTKTEENQQTESPIEQTSGIAGINKDLTTIFTDLSSTVLKGAQQLKHAVEEKSLLGNFTKEHDKFVTEKRTQQRREEAAVPPWVGYVEEEEMKKAILALSKEKRNFLRNQPPGANFHFDMAAVFPVALATLEVDENLKQMRFDLVPKQINEETFWRNYFYRVSLIKQSTQLSALANQNRNTESADGNSDLSNERNRKLSESQDLNQEFVSEDYDTSAVSMDDIRREIEQLTVTKKNPNKNNAGKTGSPDESEWDKALAEDLDNVSPEELEAQINQMLERDSQ
ncbi:unnamed protein product [Adineta ricciae]|uniref:BSD domain-containing protein n=1 Tax=Adineta ricciae TaxID=249248 RepID=A0A815FWP6_ADIRI|nr:unnamed protein product [Adineta ricciae]CAF1330901.1 unnamed protein product [Adineta ricciae]